MSQAGQASSGGSGSSPSVTEMVVTTSRDLNSGTVNVAATSPSTTVPLMYGAFNEVVFNTLCTSVTDGTAAPGWTGSSTSGPETPAGSTDLSPFFSIDNGPFRSDQSALIFTTPNNLDVGVYRMDYKVFFSTNGANIDLTVTLGGGSPIPIRSQLSTYTDFGGSCIVSMVDYFTVSSANSSCVLTWQANGNTSPSSGFAITICDCLRITRMD